MPKPRFILRRFALAGFLLCLCIFTACENLTGDDTKSESEKPNTFVKFTNLERFKVTVYRDSLRQNTVAEVRALGSTTVAGTPSLSGIAFYPTFHLDIFDMPGISIPYNGPTIVTQIEPNKTNPVPVPKLESIEINSAYIKLTNNSNVSLSLRQGGISEVGSGPLGDGSSVITTGKSVVYKISPGPVSNYSIMHNTTTPVAFPANFTEFRQGIIYVLAYDGTSLTLADEVSVVYTIIPPAAPENVNAETVSSNSALITWDAVFGATSYRIYRATSAAGTYSSVGTSVTASYTVTSLSAGQAYYYKISALSNSNMESVQSAAVFAIMPPGNVRVTAVTINSVSLAWNAFSGASGYNVYRSDSEDGTYSKINTAAVTGTEFTDTGLSRDTSYWYKVSAIVSDDEGFPSIQISAFTSSFPDNVRITSADTTHIVLAWNAVPEASGYNVYRSDSENGTYSKVNNNTITGTNFTDTGLSPDTTYWYKVSSIIDSAEGLPSSQIPASTLTSVPGNVRITASGTSSVTLAWNVVSEASGYNIYRSNSENGTYNLINTGTVTGTEFTNTGVSAHSTYWYKVSAIVNAVESLLSTPVSANTGDIVSGSGLTAKLVWLRNNAVSGANYTVEVSANESISPTTLSYSGKTNIGITLRGTGAVRTVSLSSNGAMFTVESGVTLVLDNNITLQGRSDNNNSLVLVNSGGTLVMNTGSRITGNTFDNVNGHASSANGGGVYVNGTFTMNGGEVSGNRASASEYAATTIYSYGGGVYVSGGTFTINGGKVSGNTAVAIARYTAAYSHGGGVCMMGGTFTMNGGEISGNTASASGYYNSSSSGGGVSNSGIFRMSGGVIYGNNAATGIRNAASSGVALTTTTAQYGTFSGEAFFPSGNLTTTDTTIRIVNGNLLTE